MFDFSQKQERIFSMDKKWYISKRMLIWILPVLMAVGIFLFSAQPGDDSAQLSSGFIQTVLNMLSKVKIFQNRDMEELIVMLSTPVRKGAHITEYIILYLSLVLAMYVSKLWKYRWVIFALAITFLYACTDEFHQTFVPGRAGRFTDVLIDSTGALAVCIFLFYRMRKRQMKENADGRAD